MVLARVGRVKSVFRYLSKYRHIMSITTQSIHIRSTFDSVQRMSDPSWPELWSTPKLQVLGGAQASANGPGYNTVDQTEPSQQFS